MFHAINMERMVEFQNLLQFDSNLCHEVVVLDERQQKKSNAVTDITKQRESSQCRDKERTGARFEREWNVGGEQMKQLRDLKMFDDERWRCGSGDVRDGSSLLLPTTPVTESLDGAATSPEQALARNVAGSEIKLPAL